MVKEYIEALRDTVVYYFKRETIKTLKNEQFHIIDAFYLPSKEVVLCRGSDFNNQFKYFLDEEKLLREAENLEIGQAPEVSDVTFSYFEDFQYNKQRIEEIIEFGIKGNMEEFKEGIEELLRHKNRPIKEDNNTETTIIF